MMDILSFRKVYTKISRFANNSVTNEQTRKFDIWGGRQAEKFIGWKVYWLKISLAEKVLGS